MRSLTNDAARRIALGAQGFTRPRPKGRIDARHYRRLFATIGLLQLDSVNVVARSHYLPVLARLGAYDAASLDRYTSTSGEIFEYWGHEASLLPIETYPLFQHRMKGMSPWRRVKGLEEEHPGYLDAVYDEIAEHGPMTVSDLSDPGMRTGPWWGYGPGKIALEWLFATGRITAYRNGNFARLYDLPERVLPPAVLEAPAVPKTQAYRELIVMGARHLGIGTTVDLADYYRLHLPTARPIVADLAAEGKIEEVEVEGWVQPAYVHPQAVRPRGAAGTALLSPFDPIVWNRDRAERIFGFRYRIEIYVPEPKRVHGYYVLPFLLDGDLVGRADFKADRKARRLLVRSAFVEDGQDPSRVAAAMAERIHEMAGWLGMADVALHTKGNLVSALRRRL